MASIVERKNKETTSWQVTIRIKGSPKIVQSFPSKPEAETFARVTERKIRTGRGAVLPERALAATALDFQNEELRSVIRMFIRSERCKPHYKKMAPKVLKAIGDVKVGDVRRSWIKAYLTSMKPRLSHMGRPLTWATLKGHLGLVGLAIRWRANELDVAVPQFPFSSDLLPKGWQNNRERRLSETEENALMATLAKAKIDDGQNQWPLLVGLALETGARLQELILATWSEVDLAERLWTLPKEHTKCKYSRAIPLSAKAMSIVAQLMAQQMLGDQRIFHTMLNPKAVSQNFRLRVKHAGLVDYRFHDLRHEAISRMVLRKRQLSVYEIMRIAGHGSLAMLNRYANLRGSELASRME
ncbi:MULTISPECIES: site-specific integrase [Rugamonas]|nr:MULTISPECIES: site-specific integrase [Rugamonas]